MTKISVQDAARKYGCKDNRLYKAMRRGSLSVYRELGRVYLDDEELQQVFRFTPRKEEPNV